MAQQNIDFGTFPDDPSADAIRTAFNKVQNNFDQLFGANANTTVTSINRTPGAGVTVNYPTGNVVISANLACLQVSTSSLKMGRGGNSGSNALITQASQTLVIDINPDQVYSNYFADVNNGLSVFNGNLSSNSSYQANLTSFGNLTSLNVDGRANFTGSNTYISSVSNLHIPGGGAGYTIVTDGAGNLSWSAVTAGSGTPGGNATEIQFQGSGGNLGRFAGNAGFNFTIANGLLQTPLLTVAGDAVAANFIGTLANGNSNISIVADGNVTISSTGNANILTVTDLGINVAGNANVGNIGAAQGIFTTSANIPLIQNGNSNITIGANTTISMFVTGNTTPAISATLTGANISGIANVTGNIVTEGNISTTGTNGTVQANNFNVTGAASGNANVSTVTGNLGIRAISSTYTDTVAAPSSTITNGAIHAIGQPTLTTSNGSVTFTNAATFYIANSPANAGSTTITNPYSLYIANGSTYFGGANNFIAGNLTVGGNATYYNVTSFVVQDPIISLGGGANGNALTNNDGKDRGTALQYYTTAPVTAFMGWDNSNSEFSFGSNVTIASEVVSYNSLGNVRGLTWLGNIDGSYANFTGNITTTANANLGNSVIANYFIGRFYGSSNSIANGTSNVNISTINEVVTIGVAGNANIVTVTGTGVNIAGTLNTGSGVISTSGNANLGNLGTTQVLASANITTPQFISNIATANGAPFSVQSTNRVSNLNVSYANVSDYSVVTTQNTGTYYPLFVNANTTGNYALGSNTLISANLANGALIATTFVGNITGNIGGILANGNSNVSIPSSNGNINLVAVGNTTLIVTGTGVNVAGTLNTGNANLGNLGTAQVLASANVTAPQLISNIATGTPPLIVTSTTLVANLSVATAGSATTAGAVTTNAQPNITSVGALTSLTVTGNITNGNITGGNLVSASYISGTLTTASQPNITSLGTLLNTTLGSSNSFSGGNLISANYFTGTLTTNSQPNITSVGTLNGLAVSGNSANGTQLTVSDTNPAAGSSKTFVLGGGSQQLAFVANITNGSYNSLQTTGDMALVATGSVQGNVGLSILPWATAASGIRISSVSNVATITLGAANTNATGALNVTTSVTTPQLISNIASGTAPLTVTSTTRVANLNVAYANVSDFGTITARTTGTYYPVMVNGAANGNYALSAGPTSLSFNLASNTILTGNLTATNTVQAANITSTGFIQRAVTTGISANGTSQANATVLTTEINIVSAVNSGTGVILPAAVAGTVVYITNNTANSLIVYPQSGAQISNLGTNIGFTQGANATLQFIAPTTSQWYTIGATYA